MRTRDSSSSWLTKPVGVKKWLTGIACLAGVLVIGWVDYKADYRLQFTVLYVLPICFATIYVGRFYAIMMAILSVAVATEGDILSGEPSPGIAIRTWNDAISLSLFLIVVLLLDALCKTLIGLESKVVERTGALREGMEERKRLEREILDLSERERQAFGHELHDVICQDLASIAITSHLVVRKLEAKQIAETDAVRDIANMMDQTLNKTRRMAKGFFTSGFDALGLTVTLQEIARSVQERSGIVCDVSWQETLDISDKEIVIHLFRIAQEAIQNAVKHAEPSLIEVSLQRIDREIRLAIRDDGKGLDAAGRLTEGLGLRIMAYRAGLIGGTLKIERPESGGTRITCSIPEEKVSGNNAVGHG